MNSLNQNVFGRHANFFRKLYLNKSLMNSQWLAISSRQDTEAKGQPVLLSDTLAMAGLWVGQLVRLGP